MIRNTSTFTSYRIWLYRLERKGPRDYRSMFCVPAALVRAKSDGFERLSSTELLRFALNADYANPNAECGRASFFVWLAVNANRAIPDVISR